MNAAACSDRKTLEAFALGNLPDANAETVAAHLDQCPTCEAVVASLDNATDSFLAELRRPEGAAFAAEDQCRAALLRASAIGAPGVATAVSAAQQVPIPQLGEYELLEKLGEGGMGAVYKARHTRLKRVVALKVLPPEKTADPRAIARFEREMEAVGQLVHPNIVQAHDAREIDGTYLLVMEYVEGMDLGKLSRRLGPLPIADACEIVRQAALALEYANQHGLVHRDIKPSNLMLHRRTPAASVKILDLGLALLAEERRDAAVEGELTAAGHAMGTADYMAPEQADDAHSVDIRADVYSLGCTLYKLLTGRAPFAGPRYKSDFDKMMAHCRDPITPVRQLRGDVPEELAAVLERMLAKDPAERFATPGELEATIAPLADGADLAALLARAEQQAESSPLPQQRSCTTVSHASSALKGTDPFGLSLGKKAAEQAGATLSYRPAPRVSRWRRVTRWAVAAGLLPILFFFGVILWINNTRIEVPDGSEVHVAQDGTVTVTLPDGETRKTKLPEAGEQDSASQASYPPPPLAVAPFDSVQAKKHQQAWADYLGVPVELTNSIGMKLVLIPPGEFQMGSSGEVMEAVLKELQFWEDEKWMQAVRWEGPEHRVKITQPFWMGAYPVTQAEYRQIMGNNPSHYSPTGLEKEQVAGLDTDRFPVETVDWVDAVEFCRKLSALADETSAERSYRLPTEAQWEMACRAGTTSRFFWGDDGSKGVDDYASLISYRQVPESTSPVGQRKSNAWSLFDMHGNVWEYCSDWFDPAYYQGSPAEDPQGPESGKMRVMRGGSWRDSWYNCRSAKRQCTGSAWGRNKHVGFRVACSIGAEATARRPKQEARTASPSPGRVVLTPEPLEIATGEPLSRNALVLQPAPIEGIHSWTIETIAHRGSYPAAAFSPDGQTVATVCNDPTVRFWDTSDGSFLRAIVAHDLPISGLAWCPDGRLLATASADRTVRIWDAASGRRLATFAGESAFRSIDWSSDPRYLAAGCSDGTVHFWEFTLDSDDPAARTHRNGWVPVRSGIRSREVPKQHGYDIRVVRWSPDGKTLATADGRHLKLWDGQAGTPKPSIPFEGPFHGEFSGKLTSFAWSPDGSQIVTNGKPPRFLCAVTGKLLSTGPDEMLADQVAWSPDGKRVTASTWYGPPSYFDLESGKVLVPSSSDARIPSLAYSPDGRLLAGARVMGRVELCDPDTLEPQHVLPAHTASVRRAAWSPDGTAICTASVPTSSDPVDSGLRLVRMTSAETLWETLQGWEYIENLSWSADGKRLAAGYEMFDGTSGRHLFRVMGMPFGSCGAWFPVEPVLATYYPPRSHRLDVTKFIDISTGELLREFSGSGEALTWSPDGKSVALGLQTEITLRDAQTGDVAATLAAPAGNVRVMAWSPDGRLLAAGMDDGKVHVFDIESGALQGTGEGHTGTVVSLAWLDEGSKLASGTSTEVCVWDASGELLRTIPDDGGTFSPDGRLVASRGASSLRLWDLDDGRYLRTLLTLRDRQYAAIAPEGHYSGSPDVYANFVYIVQTDEGQQTLTPAEFAERYGWNNDPANARSLDAAPTGSASAKP